MRAKVIKQRSQAPRLFLDSKTERVMQKLGWDFGKFKRAYDEDPGMRGRRSRVPSANEIHAVEQFLKAGDFAALKKALRTENLQTANAAVARVVAYKAQQKGGRDAAGES